MAVIEHTTEPPPAGPWLALHTAESALRGLLVEVDPALLESSDAAALIEHAATVERLAGATVVLLAARAAESQVWADQSLPSAELWLSKLAGTSKTHATEVIETSKRLQKLERTQAAVRSGGLSADQAAAVASGASVDPRAEEDLLASAAVDSLWALRQAVDRVKAAADPSPEKTRERIHAGRHARHRTNADGSHTLTLTTTADVMAELRAVAEREADAIFKAAYKEGRREPHEAYLADASCPCRGLASTPGIPVSDPSERFDRSAAEGAERGPVPVVPGNATR